MSRKSVPNATMPITSSESRRGAELLPDLYGYTVQIVNVGFVGSPDASDNWVLVDAGMPGSKDEIVQAAEARFGADCPPCHILLTHGHFDHVGSLNALAEHWQVPIYAHRLELPYLTGEENYPPADTSADSGLMNKLSALFPTQPIDVGGRIQPLPEDGSVPGLPGWRTIHTPGHTPGHVSFFRDEDKALIAGDAFVTVKQESLYKVLTQETEINGPPSYFTPDWEAAKNSVQRLYELQPELALTGHGLTLEGEELQRDLEYLAHNFDTIAMPEHGRNVD